MAAASGTGRSSAAHTASVVLAVCAVLVVGAVFVLFRQSSDGPGQQLRGVTWQLRSVGDVAVDATTRPAPTLELDHDGRYGMNDTTNVSGGSVTITARRIRFGDDTASTGAGVGADPVREAVDAVVAPGWARWSLSGSELTLSRHGRVLHYHRGTTVTAARLVGTSWQVSVYGRRTAAVNPGHNSGVILRFVDDHSLVASTACTRLHARYRATATRLFITDSVVSNAPCRHYLSVAALTHVLGDGTTTWDWNGALWLTRGGSGLEYSRTE